MGYSAPLAVFVTGTSNSPNISPQAAKMAANLPVQSATMQPASTYSFPRNNLRLNQTDLTRKPLVLIACGSFSPITYLHLRMFEIASDFARDKTEFEVVGGYLSPVSDFYHKSGLTSSTHRYVLIPSYFGALPNLFIRLRICELAVSNDNNDWVMVDN
jgi:nicotinamide mononucleotide adenylyltransferase